MTHQVVDICNQPRILSQMPMTWYKWYCNKCGARGKTTNRHFECHPLSTRTTLDDTGDEE